MKLRELYFAAEEKEISSWNHTASLMALLANINKGKKGKQLTSLDFHPYGCRLKKRQRLQKKERLASMTEEEILSEQVLDKIVHRSVKLSDIDIEEKPKDKWFKLSDYKNG